MPAVSTAPGWSLLESGSPSAADGRPLVFRPAVSPDPGESEAIVAKKNKTNKSITKRLKVTGTGKLTHKACGKRHLNAHMTAKRSRQLRREGLVPPALVKKYLIAMGEY